MLDLSIFLIMTVIQQPSSEIGVSLSANGKEKNQMNLNRKSEMSQTVMITNWELGFLGIFCVPTSWD